MLPKKLPVAPAVLLVMPHITAGGATPLTVPLPDGRQLGLTRYGNPAHRAVVFHHGFGSSGLELPNDAALLARLQLQILAPDRPGVGRSSVFCPLTFPSFADDVVAMLDALAARYPARVAAVQLLSICLPLGERAGYRHLSWVWQGLLWGQLGLLWLNRTTFFWLSRQWARHPNRTIDWFIRVMRPAEARATGRLRELLRDAAVQGFVHAGRGVYDDARAWCRPPGFRIEDVQAPVRLWHGQADGVWGPGNIPYPARWLGNAPMHLLPARGHMLYLENWLAILEELAALLDAEALRLPDFGRADAR